MRHQKKKKRKYRRFCLMSGHKLNIMQKLLPLGKGFKYIVDHKKKTVLGICQFHAKLRANMMQERLDKIHLRG